MEAFWISWIGITLFLVVVTAVAGQRLRGTVWAVFIDSRNTWSLSQFQLVAWTALGLPVILALAIWRGTTGAATAWDFSIPGELLAAMGISLGSAVTSLAIKSNKNDTRAPCVGGRAADLKRPPVADMLAVEEGRQALRSLDPAKLQNFFLTVGLIATYAFMVYESARNGSGEPLGGLPVLSDSMVGLLAISHAGYLIGKVPTRKGDPAGDAATHRGGVPGTRQSTEAVFRLSQLLPDPT
jgi:hypothetical protein